LRQAYDYWQDQPGSTSSSTNRRQLQHEALAGPVVVFPKVPNFQGSRRRSSLTLYR